MIEPATNAAACSACRVVRPLAELLRVREVAGLHRSKYICRPSIDGRCFVNVRTRDLERIETALPEAPLVPRPLPERPAPAPVQPFRPGRLVATDATGNGGPW